MAPHHPVLPAQARSLTRPRVLAGSTEAETAEQTAQGSAGPSQGPGRPEDQQGLAPTQLQACPAPCHASAACGSRSIIICTFCKASAHMGSLAVCDTRAVKCKQSRACAQAELRTQARPGPSGKSEESGFGEFLKGDLPRKLGIMLVRLSPACLVAKHACCVTALAAALLQHAISHGFVYINAAYHCPGTTPWPGCRSVGVD